MTRGTEKPAHEARISHPAHPGHELQLAVAGATFQCNGCMQYGAGQSYRCEQCDYDIHTCCVPPEKTLEHPLLNGCKLDFLLKPNCSGCFCDACGDGVLGFVYCNRDRNIDLHPACAVYPEHFPIDGHMFDLHTEKDTGLICMRCKKNGTRNSFWSYQQEELGYVHLGCMIDGSRSEGQSESANLLNAPGEMTWYKSVWKLSKIFAKMAYYLLSFDTTGIFSMAGAVADFFGS